MTEFTCESCGETFTTESTELEKVAEAERYVSERRERIERAIAANA